MYSFRRERRLKTIALASILRTLGKTSLKQRSKDRSKHDKIQKRKLYDEKNQSWKLVSGKASNSKINKWLKSKLRKIDTILHYYVGNERGCYQFYRKCFSEGLSSCQINFLIEKLWSVAVGFTVGRRNDQGEIRMKLSLI